MNIVERITRRPGNPLTQAQHSAMFWRTAFWLIVPPIFLSLLALTAFVHEHQGRIRQQVAVELRP